ncbi:MAG: tetratricopeptide repeat protein, partial [Candidatus Krumholzibacteriaceae bacterium]
MTKGMRTARANIFPIMVVLLLATLVAYWHVLESDYLNFDDDVNITGNSHVSSGLDKDSLKWAFTSYYAANWHPLTWISHMLDYQLYGAKPMGHHLTNLLFHMANAILLFLVLTRMTGYVWRSAFVAALFALHPLHVESVAWVTERKDVLSTFFWMLTMFAYVYYTEKPSIKRYVLVPVLMCFGLMAKPMLVTLPFVLLMLDYWPLGRLWPQRTVTGKGTTTARQLILEKLPLLALSVVSCVITYEAQRSGGAVAGTSLFPLSARVTNAMVTYISYLAKMVWPAGLSAFYLRPSDPRTAWQITGAGLLLVSISALAIRAGINRRYLLTGWLWYVVTLVPVIGLVQLGVQSKADRFTYIPLIGIFFIIAWGLPELFTKRASAGGARARPAQHKTVAAKPKFGPLGPLAIPAGVVLVILAACTWHQVGFWRNSGTLFEHAVAVNPANYAAHNNLGTYLLGEGRTDEALAHFKEAVRIKPDF